MQMHIGQLIQEKLKESGKTVVWFADKMACHRTNVYKIFGKRTIDTQELLLASKILKYDFFKHYSSQLEEEE